jgi:site-specific DNA-methyltransferase (adenine-specific)
MINLLVGDALVRLKELDDNSVHSIVCDPPYGLGDPPPIREVLLSWLYSERYVAKGGGFMGKDWDSFVPSPDIWRECFRVLRPGGHLLAFFGTRTADLGSISIRLAGFERRDTVAWIYGSGFPKSLNIGKAIDAAAGAEREVVGKSRRHTSKAQSSIINPQGAGGVPDITAPTTDAAKKWEGWGSALKPAFEPIAVFRKPLSEKTIAANVLEHETGGMNIDVCRVTTKDLAGRIYNNQNTGWKCTSKPSVIEGHATGRWPANVVHDGSDEVLEVFPDTKGAVSNGRSGTRGVSCSLGGEMPQAPSYSDTGSAARFFFCAQADEAGEFTDGNDATATDDAKESDGSGQALKPEFEPISVFRKPLSEKTIAANVLKHETGGMNIDGCRVPGSDAGAGRSRHGGGTMQGSSFQMPDSVSSMPAGRWPANLVHDGSSEVLEVFPDAKSAGKYTKSLAEPEHDNHLFGSKLGPRSRDNWFAGESGSSARFFYCAKVNKSERNDGLEDATNNHPTLKPTALMRWLVRLVTVRGGVVLDPFMGSGSTGRAAALEKCSFIGCELDPAYLAIAVKRIAAVTDEEIIESVPDLEAEAAKKKAQTDRTLGFLAALVARRKTS